MFSLRLDTEQHRLSPPPSPPPANPHVVYLVSVSLSGIYLYLYLVSIGISICVCIAGTGCQGRTPGAADPSRACWLRVPPAWTRRATGGAAALLSRVPDDRRGLPGPTREGEGEGFTILCKVRGAWEADSSIAIVLLINFLHSCVFGLFRSCLHYVAVRFSLSHTHPTVYFRVFLLPPVHA